MTTYLLDTHILLWMLADDPQLGPETRRIIMEEDVYASTASVWEISIKISIGKLEITGDLEQPLKACGVPFLRISNDHALYVKDLRMHHRDPFDRLLIAQAICEGMVLLTNDSKISLYDVRSKSGRN